jgi:hypothetical protein
MELELTKIIRTAWQIFQKNIFLLISMTSIMLLITGGMNIIQTTAIGGLNTQFFIFSIASNLFSMGLTIGSIQLILNIIYEKDASLGQLFGSFHMLGHYLVGSLILVLAVLCIIIPILLAFMDMNSIIGLFRGLFWGKIDEAIGILSNSYSAFYLLLSISIAVTVAMRLQFYPYYIIKYEIGPITALHNSLRATSGVLLQLLLIGTVLVFLNFAGLLLMGFGVFFTLPFSFITMAIIFDQLNTRLTASRPMKSQNPHNS